MQVVLTAIHDAFYRLTDSRSQIQSYVFDVVRATVPKMILDDVFTVSGTVAGQELVFCARCRDQPLTESIVKHPSCPGSGIKVAGLA